MWSMKEACEADNPLKKGKTKPRTRNHGKSSPRPGARGKRQRTAEGFGIENQWRGKGRR